MATKNPGIPVEIIGENGEYYPGHVCGFTATDKLTFKFLETSSFTQSLEIEVHPSSLRASSRDQLHPSSIKNGLNVEVLLGDSEPSKKVLDDGVSVKEPTSPLLAPSSWWPARVSKVKGDFVVLDIKLQPSNGVASAGEGLYSRTRTPPFVKLPAPGATENIVDKDQLRLQNTEHNLTEADFHFHVISFPSELADLCSDEDNIAQLVQVCGSPVLVSVVTPAMQLPSETNSTDAARLLVLSTNHTTILRVKLIEGEFVKALRQKYSLRHQIDDLTRKLEATRSHKDTSYCVEEFAVSPTLIGIAIGARGTNINRARAVEGVISVNLDPKTCSFNVIGRTENSVKQARKILEFATEVMQVPQFYVARIIGQYNRHIQALVDRVGLARIKVQSAEETTIPDCVPFTFTGTRSAIADAKLLINFNVECLRELDILRGIQEPLFVHHPTPDSGDRSEDTWPMRKFGRQSNGPIFNHSTGKPYSSTDNQMQNGMTHELSDSSNIQYRQGVSKRRMRGQGRPFSADADQNEHQSSLPPVPPPKGYAMGTRNVRSDAETSGPQSATVSNGQARPPINHSKRSGRKTKSGSLNSREPINPKDSDVGSDQHIAVESKKLPPKAVYPAKAAAAAMTAAS